MSNKSLGLVLLISILVVGIGGCSNAEANVIRIAFFPNITHSQALVGQATGVFEEAFGDDIEVRWTAFNAGPAEIQAVFAGEIDIGYIGPIPAINAFLRSDGDVKIIAGATNAGAVLVTREDLLLNDVAELSGKRIAIPQLGNTQHLSLLNILTQHGLKTMDKGGTVQVFESQNADTKTLMDRGDIDAALVPEPWGSRLVNEIGANIMLDEKEIWLDGNYSTAVVIVSMDFLKSSPHLVELFLKTHIELTEYINQNTEDAKIIVNERLYELTQNRLEPEVLDEAFDRLIVSYDPASDSIMQFIDIYIEEMFITDFKNRGNLLDLSKINKILDNMDLPEIN